MKIARKLFLIAAMVVAGSAFAQVPDLVSAFDAGGRAMGAGGSMYGTSANTMSATMNPAGLGFVNQRQFGFATRSFPTSFTGVTGDLDDLRLDTTSFAGDLRASHVGIASPMAGNRGTWGIAWTVGGLMHDDQGGFNLGGGVQSYLDAVRLKTDFLNLSYGKANADMTFAWGFGLVVANQQNYNRRRIVFSDPQIPEINSRAEDNEIGFGAQIGAMWVPRSQPNATFGISVRTPIDLNNTDGAMGLYSKIPGRVAAGFAFRQDGYRNGADYLIWAGEAQYFFDAIGSERVMRDDYATGHFGLEYNYNASGYTIPLRLGYAILPAGGDDFADRNTFTYGFGYRPNGKNWSVDFNFGTPNGGGRDTAISVSYRF